MPNVLDHFIGRSQLLCIRAALRGEEGEWFKARMREIVLLFETMPKVYEQDGLCDAAIVHLHYFTGGCDWWITERDISEEQEQAFGLADLFGDGGEIGYISIREIIKAGAELDLHWTPKTLAEVRSAEAVQS